MEEGSSSLAQRATLLFMEEGCKVITVSKVSSVGCPDVSDLGGGLGQAPQDGLAAYERGQLSV